MRLRVSPGPQARQCRMSKIHDAELQYLTVAYAKTVGIDADGRIVTFDPDRISREAAKLSPLLIYSLAAPCYGVMYRQLVDRRAPVALGQFLAGVWAIEDGLGMPLRLELPAKLLALDRGALQWVRSAGVDVGEAYFPKAINAFGNSAQELTAIAWGTRLWGVPVSSLAQANAGLRSYDQQPFRTSAKSSMQEATYEAWRHRPKRFYAGTAPASLDWDVDGLKESKISAPRPGMAVVPGSGTDIGAIDGVKQMLAMWPSERKGFLKGLSVQAKDFDFWLKGRARLAREEYTEVVARLGAEYDDWGGGYRLSGGNLLVASTPRQTVDLYNELSCGGDLEYSFEILAPEGAQALGMRVLVFKACGRPANIILFEAGSRCAALLDEPAGRGSTLINIQRPRVATKRVWSAAVKIVEGYRTVASPQTVGRVFGEKHAAWLEAGREDTFFPLMRF